MRTAITTLVLDIGGVVYRSLPDEAFYERWSALCGCDSRSLAERLWGGSQWRAAELGEIPLDQCIDICAVRVGVDRDRVRTMVFEAYASQPDEALAEYVASLRARGVAVVALTNSTSREVELLRRPELVRLFDRAISSADAGLRKPDPAFFRYALGRLKTGSGKVVFVDDNAANVDAARAFGWRSILHRSTEETMIEIENALAESAL